MRNSTDLRDAASAPEHGRAGLHGEERLVERVLGGRYDFSCPHRLARQRFEMSSTMTMKAPNGRAVSSTVYRLAVDCDPGAARGGDRYVCREFTVQHDDEAPLPIPSLSGWSYTFTHLPGEGDSAGRTLGIDHAPFEHLVDANETPLSELDSYHVYNAFIDFHALQVFTDPSSGGPGIQDVHEVGARIVHAASHSKPDTNLGESVAAGSWFENGEVTLEFVGLGRVLERACAVLSVDSGASSFRMLTKPAPEVELTTEGSSHYWATIYKDLESMWIQRATLTELVVSETVVPGSATPVHGVAERSILVMNVTADAARRGRLSERAGL